MIKINYSMRQELERLLNEEKKVTLLSISRKLGLSRTAVYYELGKNLSEEDFESRNYKKYSADKAQERAETAVLEKLRGKTYRCSDREHGEERP